MAMVARIQSDTKGTMSSWVKKSVAGGRSVGRPAEVDVDVEEDFEVFRSFGYSECGSVR